MANKKKAAKKKDAPADAAAANEGEGEEVTSEPAIVEEANIQVRGKGVGGVVMMTKTQHDAFCKENAKKK
jgi:hypothetical protein